MSSFRKTMPARAARVSAVAAVTLAGLGTLGAATAGASPQQLPAGKANWVVSVGGLNTAAVNNYRNWVRLGYYTFDPAGTVTTTYWNWSQRDEPVRVDTVTADCGSPIPVCKVKTVQGFNGAPTGGFRGSYSYTTDGRLRVDWTADSTGRALSGTLTEYWTLQAGVDDGKLARMTSPTFQAGTVPAAGQFSNYSATFGVGWGSNASLSSASRVSMSHLLSDPASSAMPLKGRYDVANAGTVSQQHAGFGPLGSGDTDPASLDHDNPWKPCANGLCLGWLQHQTGNCTAAGYSDHDRVRYLAEIGDGRRDTQWYWCRFHAESHHETCYQSNSHPQPMLQIVDDAGAFQGWVGVEVFTHVDASTLVPDEDWANGYFAVFEQTGFSQFY